jgi:hypothetical protein
MKIINLKELTLLGSTIALVSSFSYADEGGVSFWLPGQFVT